MTEIETFSLQTQQKTKWKFCSGRAGRVGDHVQVTCTATAVPVPFQKSSRVPCPSGKHKGMLKLASASVGGQVVLASSNDDRNPPENIVDG